jgi:DNA-binding NtrC family response regulator
LAERARLILLVDGDAAPRRAARWCLSRAGFSVLAFDSAEDAVGVIDEGLPVDAVVADIAVPGIQTELFPASLKPNPRVALDAITAPLNRRSRKRASARTTLAYLEKPLDLDQLVESVQRAIKACSTARR